MFLYKDIFGIKKPVKVDMTLNNETKPKHNRVVDTYQFYISMF